MKPKARQSGFTLIELIVVMGIIALVSMIGMTAVRNLFASGLKAQARNTVDAQLKAARGLAIRDRRYTGVHFQKHFFRDEYWAGVVQELPDNPNPIGRPELNVPAAVVLDTVTDPAQRWFGLAPEMQPAKLPDGVAVGIASDPGADLAAFTTFTVLFSPDGRLVTNPTDVKVRFVKDAGGVQVCSQAFTNLNKTDPQPVPQPNWKIWDPATAVLADACVPAVRVFDFKPVIAMTVVADRKTYVDSYSRFLPIGPYLGGLLPGGSTKEGQ